jgi:predicted PhzF superfamily epimerase YddE/YHI9
MQIHELKCFGAVPGEGNPALVIEAGASAAEVRQAFARERNTTCVYIDKGDGGVVLDYFYPHARSPLCLHATLAAARVLLAKEKRFGTRQQENGIIGSSWREPDFPATPLTVTTALRGQALVLARDGEDFYVRLAAQPAPEASIPPGLPQRLLRAPTLLLSAPPRIASVGSAKLLLEVADRATLHALEPDLPAIAAWGKEHGVNGLYPYCRHPDGRYEGRNFNHLDPALEDSATGVAAGALTALLGHGITLLQGRRVNRDCLIRTRVEPDGILIGGRADLA